VVIGASLVARTAATVTSSAKRGMASSTMSIGAIVAAARTSAVPAAHAGWLTCSTCTPVVIAIEKRP